MVYQVSRLCSSLAEEICDDYVTESLKSGERFARLLVAMAERVVNRVDLPLALGILPTRRHDLERRITRLMKKERKMKTRLSLNHVVLVALFGLVMMGTSVLSTVWADSRVDVPADASDNEAVVTNDGAVYSTNPKEETNSLNETSVDQTASIEESLEKNDVTLSPAKRDTSPGNISARSQVKFRLLKERKVSRYLPYYHGYRERLSPDGLKVVYRSVRDPNMITVSDLSTGVERNYEQQAYGSFSPVWSPDGKRIAFMATKDEDWRVRILTLDSGDVEKTDIVDIPCDWSRDGRFLLVVDIWKKGTKELQLVDLQTGESQVVIRPFKLRWYPEMPRLSPDGKHVVYHVQGAEQTIFVQPVDGSDGPTRITSEKGGGWHPLWSADGNHILFMSNHEVGSRDLLSIAFQNGRPVGEPTTLISGLDGNVFLYSCSNSGRLLFAADSYRYDIASTNIDPVSGIVLGEPALLTDSKTEDSWPVWSLNGQYIAYNQTAKSGDVLLCVMNSDGRDKRTLSSINTFIRKGTMAWHPDNEHILYAGWEAHPENSERTLTGIYSVSIRSHERNIIYHDPQFQGGMHLSPDGQHLALTSGSDQKPQLYMVDYDGQNRRQLVKSDGVIEKPTFTPDGKEIIYTFQVSAEGKEYRRSIMAVSIEGGEPREIYASEDPNDGFDTRPSSWLQDGRYVFDIRHNSENDHAQYAINMDGKSDPVRISEIRGGGGHSISPEGTKAVYTEGERPLGKLWLMSDFLPNDELAKN